MTFTEPGTADVQNLYARFGEKGRTSASPATPTWCPPGDEAAWTVPPFAAEIHDGVLYGRGAVDMKGAVACYVAAALHYLAAHGGKVKGSLSFLITGDEEGAAINGTKKVLDWLKARGEKLDACVVGNGARRKRAAVGDEIKIRPAGSLNGELVVKERSRATPPYPHVRRTIRCPSSRAYRPSWPTCASWT